MANFPADLIDKSFIIMSAQTYPDDASGWKLKTFDVAAGSDVPTASNTVVAETTFDLVSNAGASPTYARGDHTHGSPAAVVYPHLVNGNPFALEKAQSGTWDIFWYILPYAGMVMGAMRYGVGNTCWIEFYDLLEAGTWTLMVRYEVRNDFALMNVSLDGNVVTTIDQQQATDTFNVVTTVTGIVVATTNNHVIRFTCNGATTPGSSNYIINLHHWSWLRTGA